MSLERTPRSAPVLTLVAGPNGSGKSTITALAASVDETPVIDPDAFARELSPEDPSRAALAGARAAIVRSRLLLAERASFIVESTLAGHGAMSLLKKAKLAGYRTRLVYVSLRDPELHIERVTLRVARGGHDVPDADIRRRYSRSMARAPELMRLANETLVLDNSGATFERMLALRDGKIVWSAGNLPAWVQEIVSQLK